MDQNYTSLLAVFVSGVLAFITYLNYRLNKTLNIKNQLHNEKVKIYRDLIKVVLEVITVMDEGNKLVLSDKKEKSTRLGKVADELDNKSKNLHNLIIESFMIVPDRIAKLLTEFTDLIHLGPTGFIEKDYLTNLEEIDTIIREKAESLIEAFRDDLGTSKLNYKLGKN